MVVGVDQYKRIRKMAAEEGLSQREIARRLGISRNTVARYCRGEHMPWEQVSRARKPGIVNQDIEQFIRSCLEHDKGPDVPKKQHHTARRIYERLVEEKGFTGGESTVRRWVNLLRDGPGEAYMPLHFALGAYYDWIDPPFRLSGSVICMKGLHVTHLPDPLLEATPHASSIGQQGAAYPNDSYAAPVGTELFTFVSLHASPASKPVHR